ncbi:MAG: transposase [Ktedonobacteraceae bacterium]|nr:transposase [Ktedonobacteraceae bacterium]
MMARPCASVEQVVQLGIDDFSFRRGRTFGTILVDLQSRQVIDLLPDRSVETVSAWMKAHQEIRLVSRDRAGDYASAAARSAPQARQCADRFHLLKNLGEALQAVLARHLAAHRNHVAQQSRATPLETLHAVYPPKLKPKQAEIKQAKREERLARYQQVVTLRKLGFSQTAIAQQVGVAHSTVSRWLSCGTFPEQQPRRRKKELDSHLSYLRQRWEAGCHNIRELYRELVARGYTHSYWSVYEQLVRFLPEGRKNQEVPDQLPRPPVLARQAVFLTGWVRCSPSSTGQPSRRCRPVSACSCDPQSGLRFTPSQNQRDPRAPASGVGGDSTSRGETKKNALLFTCFFFDQRNTTSLFSYSY